MEEIDQLHEFETDIIKPMTRDDYIQAYYAPTSTNGSIPCSTFMREIGVFDCKIKYVQNQPDKLLDMLIQDMCSEQPCQLNTDITFVKYLRYPTQLVAFAKTVEYGKPEVLACGDDMFLGMKNIEKQPITVTMNFYNVYQQTVTIYPDETVSMLDGYPIPIICTHRSSAQITYTAVYTNTKEMSPPYENINLMVIYSNITGYTLIRGFLLRISVIISLNNGQYLLFTKDQCSVVDSDECPPDCFEICHKKYESDVGYVLK
jgi:hypothetical protein